MKRTVIGATVVVVLASMLVGGLVLRHGSAGIVRGVHAQEGCSLATLQGEYLWTGTAQANIDQRDDPTYPRAFAGVLTFDGAGNLSSLHSGTLGGEITRRATRTGTYTLDSDCTGTVHNWLAPGTNWDLFVSRDGGEGNLIRYDDGAIATRSFKKR